MNWAQSCISSYLIVFVYKIIIEFHLSQIIMWAKHKNVTISQQKEQSVLSVSSLDVSISDIFDLQSDARCFVMKIWCKLFRAKFDVFDENLIDAMKQKKKQLKKTVGMEVGMNIS